MDINIDVNDIKTCDDIDEGNNNSLTSSSSYLNGRWSYDEHIRFLKGCLLFGNNWKKVENYVKSRTSSQIRSHAQKFFIRIRKNLNALNLYLETMENIKEFYNTLTEICNIPKEDARFILPNGQHTNIAVTMNCRTLKNFFGLRLCSRAQWEIREMAMEMANICKEKMPEIFVDCKFAEPKCVQLGFCTEPKKQWCHKMPHITEINHIEK